MAAIFKKEMRSYFTTPSGYVYLTIFIAASGFIFFFTCFNRQTTDVSGYFTFLMFAYSIILPLLTAKTFSEEKKQGTEQLILTSSLSIPKLVAAKFLSCVVMFLASLVPSYLMFASLFIYGKPNVGRIIGGTVGVFLIAVCFIAIGIFVSSLTKNQFVAALGTIGILAFFLAVGLLSGTVDSPVIKTVIDWISVYSRFTLFTYGLFDAASAIYYISVAAVFLFLTVRVYEKRRYA